MAKELDILKVDKYGNISVEDTELNRTYKISSKAARDSVLAMDLYLRTRKYNDNKNNNELFNFESSATINEQMLLIQVWEVVFPSAKTDKFAADLCESLKTWGIIDNNHVQEVKAKISEQFYENARKGIRNNSLVR